MTFSSEIIFMIIGAVIFGVGLVVTIFWQKKQSARLHELLQENYEVGKILVRRDMELSEANTRLIALDQSKSEFVSIAAHQLRTPLTGIRWTFNALVGGEFGTLTAEQQRIVQSGLKSSVRMIELINDLLNVARIEEGRFGMRFQKQSIRDLLHQALERASALAQEKGISLDENIPDTVPVAEIDAEKMAIVFENMIDNAIKYTPPGGHVTVAADGLNGQIEISVADTGIGIPADQVDRIFSKFFRADNALRFQTSGSGLGLYVVKNVMDAHGGNASVSSVEGRGTKITINFPVKRRPGR